LSEVAPRRVVFGPDLIIAALFDSRARAVLNDWRDGRIIPVLNRELLLLSLKTLRQAGFGPDLIRKWSLWLTSPDKAIYLDDFETRRESINEICLALADAHKLEVLRHTSS
jgi:hypothetical protein